MGAINVETAAIGQHFIQLTIVLRVGPLPLPFNFESARIEQRVLIFIVPDGLRGRQARIVPDDGDANWRRDLRRQDRGTRCRIPFLFPVREESSARWIPA